MEWISFGRCEMKALYVMMSGSDGSACVPETDEQSNYAGKNR